MRMSAVNIAETILKSLKESGTLNFCFNILFEQFKWHLSSSYRRRRDECQMYNDRNGLLIRFFLLSRHSCLLSFAYMTISKQINLNHSFLRVWSLRFNWIKSLLIRGAYTKETAVSLKIKLFRSIALKLNHDSTETVLITTGARGYLWTFWVIRVEWMLSYIECEMLESFCG